ncbi:hypothetical protein FPV67DRAFT_461702 [Lyophyllum atratum]|nr:hypothetical protein FPV67DRAFT_461702 [Lyophyllum atratum]
MVTLPRLLVPILAWMREPVRTVEPVAMPIGRWALDALLRVRGIEDTGSEGNDLRVSFHFFLFLSVHGGGVNFVVYRRASRI